MPRFKKDSYLTILKEDGKIGRYTAVLCQCKCGKQIRCKKTIVVNNRKKSCGYMLNETEFLTPNIMRMYWVALIANATNRNFEFKLTPQDLEEKINKQNFKCALSGLDITFPKSSNEFLIDRKWTASLDRIDSKKPYTKNNTQFVHKDINRMKMDLDEKLFLKYCKAIINKQNS
jgi:hypothetical protein